MERNKLVILTGALYKIKYRNWRSGKEEHLLIIDASIDTALTLAHDKISKRLGSEYTLDGIDLISDEDVRISGSCFDETIEYENSNKKITY